MRGGVFAVGGLCRMGRSKATTRSAFAHAILPTGHASNATAQTFVVVVVDVVGLAISMILLLIFYCC